MLHDAGLQTVGYLPHTETDIDLLASWAVPTGCFLILPELTSFNASFEIFSKAAPLRSNSPVPPGYPVDPSTMIPICLDQEYGNLFLVEFFDNDCKVIRRAPTETSVVLEEIKPILEVGAKPILFTLMRDPFDAAFEPFTKRIALERTVGFLTEGDAILAQVIAESRRRGD